jgi:hypothetical protein
MPRVNRMVRAIRNSSPVVGCIMMLQEAANILRRRLLHCYCPELETELNLLREELQTLQTTYNNYQRVTDITQVALSRGMRNLIRNGDELRNSLYTAEVYIFIFTYVYYIKLYTVYLFLIFFL